MEPVPTPNRGELRKCPLFTLLKTLGTIPKVRRVALKLALSCEGGQFYSFTARWILERHYGIKVGAYSYGPCFTPGAFPAGVTIGRYVSIAAGVLVLPRNHPLDRLSTHPFFFNSRLGYVPQDNVSFTALDIGHDAWIGPRAILTPGCKRIGIGAVVGADAVVTKDVPDFAVVGGSPAHLLKLRCPKKAQAQILAGEWWKKSAAEYAILSREFTNPYVPFVASKNRGTSLQSR